MALSPLFRPVDFGSLPGWCGDDHRPALEAFRRSAFRSRIKPYRTGGLGVSAAHLEPAFAEARLAAEPGAEQARRFFERHFLPALIRPDDRPRGFVTGFYEPIVEASPVRTERMSVPLYAPPADLVEVTGANRPDGLDPYLAFGRETPDGPVEYHDRAAIDAGALAGQGLEIAWIADPVDAYFIHVQGAARLRMPDGSERRITYAAKSGQRFTGAGQVLLELGELPAGGVTMQSIRSWFETHPNRVAAILHRNRSYIFFREAPVENPALGPVAAAKVPLTPGRSLAVDRLLHTFGTPFFIEAPELTAFGGAPFRRLVIAQDTGSAIVGAARGDLFAGSGDNAGAIAGVIRHDADFFILLPKTLLGDAP